MHKLQRKTSNISCCMPYQEKNHKKKGKRIKGKKQVLIKTESNYDNIYRSTTSQQRTTPTKTRGPNN